MTEIKQIPEDIRLLISEICHDSPISIYLPSYHAKYYRLLEDFLKLKVPILMDYSLTKKLTWAFPLLSKIINLRQAYCYPNDDVHTMGNNYHADTHKDATAENRYYT